MNSFNFISSGINVGRWLLRKRQIFTVFFCRLFSSILERGFGKNFCLFFFLSCKYVRPTAVHRPFCNTCTDGPLDDESKAITIKFDPIFYFTIRLKETFWQSAPQIPHTRTNMATEMITKSYMWHTTYDGAWYTIDTGQCYGNIDSYEFESRNRSWMKLLISLKVHLCKCGCSQNLIQFSSSKNFCMSNTHMLRSQPLHDM